jgi:hypothetical protein
MIQKVERCSCPTPMVKSILLTGVRKRRYKEDKCRRCQLQIDWSGKEGADLQEGR